MQKRSQQPRKRFHSIQSIRFKEGYAMQVSWCLVVLIVTEMSRQLRIYQQVGYKPTQTGYESSEFGYESTRYETSVGAERPNGYRSHCSVHLTLTTMKLPWLTLCFFSFIPLAYCMIGPCNKFSRYFWGDSEDWLVHETLVQSSLARKWETCA